MEKCETCDRVTSYAPANKGLLNQAIITLAKQVRFPELSLLLLVRNSF